MTLAGISLMVLALDQATKFFILKSMVLNKSVTILPDFIYFTYIQNPGTAFGFLSNLEPIVRVPFFIAATLAATVIVYMYQRLLSHERIVTRIALGMVWGGALGNLVDRLLYGKVVDFIEVRYYGVQWFPYIFNVADACITMGLSYLLFEFIITGNKKKIRK